MLLRFLSKSTMLKRKYKAANIVLVLTNEIADIL